MKKFFTLIAIALVAIGAWADTATYSPTAEYNVRPKADGSAWTTVPTAAADKALFECTASACFYVIQQYTVADIQNATSVTLTLTNGSGSDALAIWDFNGTFAADMTAADFNTAFENTTGVKPGNDGTHTTTYLLKDVTTVKNPSKFTINGTALSTLKSMASTDGTFTLLITNKTADLDGKGSSKRTFQSSNSANTAGPSLEVVTEKPACQIGEIGYTTLTEAVAACPKVTAENNEVTTITVNKDVEVSARLNIESQNVKIVGATGAEKILRKESYKNGLLFLTKDTLATLTVENIIVDGQNVEATSAVFEASNKGTTILNNVTIQNAICTTGTQGVFCNKNKGYVIINGLTMTGCTAAASKALVFVGTNNVVISGKNDFGALYIEKQNYITNEDAEGTQAIVVDATREDGVLVKNGSAANYTVTGSELALNQYGADVWLGEKTATSINTVNAQAVRVGAKKMLQNGRLVIVNGNETYNAAGQRME